MTDLTFKDLFEYLDNNFAAWRNYGDVDYIEHGGVQLRYSSKWMEFTELLWYEEGQRFMMQDGSLAILGNNLAIFDNDEDDLLLDGEVTHYAAREVGAYADCSLDVEDVKSIVASLASESEFDPRLFILDAFAQFIIGVMLGVPSYGGTNPTERNWNRNDINEDELEDLSDSDEVFELLAEQVELFLAEHGYDFSPDYSDVGILDLFHMDARYGKAKDPNGMDNMPNNWRVRLTFQGRQMDLDFFGGAAFYNLDKKDVLSTLLMDLNVCEDYPTVWDFAIDLMGWDAEEAREKADKAFEKLHKNCEQFRQLCGIGGYSRDYEQVIEDLRKALQDY